MLTIWLRQNHMTKLPRLTELADMGGEAWQSLMTQILLAYAEHHEFEYRPGPTPGPDHGVDGFAPGGGVPAMDGPVIFQAKWMWDLRKGSKPAKIMDSLNQAAEGHPEMRHWVLVTPHELTDAEQKWFHGLKPKKPLESLTVHHWGHEQITRLMRQLCPDLFARYYPLHVSSAPDQVFQRLLPAYLQHVIGQVELLDLFSLARNAADDEADQAPPLAELYTSLDVLHGGGNEAARLPDRRGPAEGGEGRSERKPATAFVSLHRRVVLLGDSGSGKSTFANFLALVLAGEWLRCEKLDLQELGLPGMATVHLERLGKDWQAGTLLPLRIVLRDFAAQRDCIGGAPVDQLWDFLAQSLGPALKDFLAPLQAHLRDAGGILILDGYDEVPDAHGLRRFVREAVLGFRKQFPGVRILLTSRTYAYQEKPDSSEPAEPVCLPAFTTTMLAPFSDAQIDLFVDAWYTHHAQWKKGRLAENAKGRATRLKYAIRHRSYLQELARRPLLLTLMAALHAWQQAELPESREKLYEDSVDLLLYRWERRKQFLDEDGQSKVQEQSAAEWFKVPQDAIKKAFEEMAFKAHLEQPDRKGVADIKLESVVAALMKAAPDTRPGRVMEYIKDRVGLLIDRGGDVYCFPHRTFQEYLAARHLTAQRFPRQLVDLVRADVERWREAVLLAGAKVARGTPSAAWQLAQKLCPRCHNMEDPSGWWLTLLAGQLLIETGIAFDKEMDDDERDCRQHIVQSLERLVTGGHLPPVDRAAAGIALGKLGDTRDGVGLRKDGLPDICFVEALPAGKFALAAPGGGEPAIVHPYQISRYPVTVAQFQAFAERGYEDDRSAGATQRLSRWWGHDGLEWKRANNIACPEEYEPVFQTPNHPRVGVSWYEAAAFCAWLTECLRASDRLRDGEVIRLPHEAEWEQAARWNEQEHTADGRYFPWAGGRQDADLAQRCNMGGTGIGHTSAAGLFPSGNSGCGTADMAGNVWEWCENWYDEKNKSGRGLRGGSWANDEPEIMCSSYRVSYVPEGRFNFVGFRVVCVGACAV